MRKCPTPLPLLLGAIALMSMGARAETTSDPDKNQPAAEDKAVQPLIAQETAPAVAAAAPVAAAPAAAPAATASTTPTLAPAAKVEDKAGGDDKADKGNKFPLHANIGIDNSFGQGFTANRGDGVDIPINGGQEVKHFDASPTEGQWSTSLSLGGSASLPKLDGIPKIGLSTGVGFSIANWLPAYSNGTAFEREIQVSDIRVGASMPSAFKEEFTGISASPSVGFSIPISLGSRQRSLITSMRGGVGFSWSSPEATWGQIGVSYSPSVGYNLYYGPATTVPGVGDATAGNGVPTDPLTGGVIPIQYCRSAENLASTGECYTAGRRGIASLSNSLGLSWSLGNHSVSLGLGYSNGFSAPLTDHPELDGLHSSKQNFSESTNGSIGYSYDIPAELTGSSHVSINFGLGSGGPAWFTAADGNQYLRFPFWNFDTPSTNMSSASFGVSVGI